MKSRPTPGTYSGRIVSGQFDEHTGRQFVECQCEIDGGEYYPVKWTGWMHTDKTRKRTLESLAYAGWDPATFDPMVFSGAEVELVVEEQTDRDGQVQVDDKGEAWVRVAWVNKPGGGAGMKPSSLDAASKRRVGAQVAQQMRAIMAQQGITPAAPAAPAPAAAAPPPPPPPPPPPRPRPAAGPAIKRTVEQWYIDEAKGLTEEAANAMWASVTARYPDPKALVTKEDFDIPF